GVLFLRRQAGATDAVVPLPMLRHRVFAACLAVATAMNFGAYAMLFLTPLYFQTVRGASALDAALVLLPMSLSFMITSQLSGSIANKLGPRVPMTAGMALTGVGLLMLALIPLNDSLVLIETGLLALGCGLGLNVGPMNAVAVANVPAARSGTASGLVNTARMVGATLGVAVIRSVVGVEVWQGAGGPGVAPAYLVGGIGELIGAAWRLRSSAVTHCAARRNEDRTRPVVPGSAVVPPNVLPAKKAQAIFRHRRHQPRRPGLAPKQPRQKQRHSEKD